MSATRGPRGSPRPSTRSSAGLPYAGAGRDQASALRGLRLERNGARRALLAARQGAGGLSKEEQLELLRLEKRLELLGRRREIIEGRLGTDFASR